MERLEAGKFDNNLLQSIRKARHFLLVLTPNALDRCVNDQECKDWVHRVSFFHSMGLRCFHLKYYAAYPLTLTCYVLVRFVIGNRCSYGIPVQYHPNY